MLHLYMDLKEGWLAGWVGGPYVALDKKWLTLPCNGCKRREAVSLSLRADPLTGTTLFLKHLYILHCFVAGRVFILGGGAGG